MSYVVGIPTKNRNEMLNKCISAFANSTKPPSKILIVNNNLPESNLELNDYSNLSIDIEVLSNSSPIKGCVQGAQVAFDWMVNNNVSIGVKWDDDLIPDETCMEYLFNWIDKYDAVGGCYPPSNETRIWKEGPCSGNPPPNGRATQLQFFKWFDDANNIPNPVEVGALYSSYMFNVESFKKTNGWNVKRSPIGFREDTEVTSKLQSRLIEPKAIATHYIIGGGGRSFTKDILEYMTKHDDFQLRKILSYNDMSFDDLFKVKEISR
ncbi:MAG: glycosyltransferase [Chitinivibrionales bacterium]|nr:glycosyltransferase [Chitinivibrionales bacterium]